MNLMFMNVFSSGHSFVFVLLFVGVTFPQPTVGRLLINRMCSLGLAISTCYIRCFRLSMALFAGGQFSIITYEMLFVYRMMCGAMNFT